MSTIGELGAFLNRETTAATTAVAATPAQPTTPAAPAGPNGNPFPATTA